MKKIGLIVFAFLLPGLIIVTGCQKQTASGTPASESTSQYRIGIVTGASQSEDDIWGAEELLRRYGAASSGGIFQHVTYPENFMDQMETTIIRISSLASDPLIKAIVVNQAVPGTAEAFLRIRERRPDIILLAGEPHEDPEVIQQAATLSISSDFISRGYTIPWAAKQLGADTFVHISFPRHMSYGSMGLRRQIFEAACADLGMRFVYVTAPDPTSDIGEEGAQQYIMEHAPRWINQYGTNANFFCTNDAHTEPLLRQLFEYGGMFVEADLPSPILGYPGALGLDVSAEAEAGDFPAILTKVENATIARGGAGRFGTWAFSYSFVASAGLGEFAKRVLDGNAQLDSTADLYEALGEFTPGAKWNGIYYVDAETGDQAHNQLLIYMDTYIMGKGFLPTTEQVVPQKYFQIKFQLRFQ